MADVAAVGLLRICLGLAGTKFEVRLWNRYGPAKWGAGYGLTVRAMADVDLFGFHFSLIGDEAAVTATVDFHVPAPVQNSSKTRRHAP